MGQFSLPEPGTVQAYNLQVVYESSLVLGLFVMLVVGYFLLMIMFNKGTCTKYLEQPYLEVFWSLASFFLLVMMCSVSVYVLYVNDETYTEPYLDVCVVGHQWYWTYQIGLGEEADVLRWDSRLIPRSKDSSIDFLDLITVDHPLMIPVGVLVRVLVTSADVIHSWGANGLGVKLDAVPGRLNRGLLEVKAPGIYWGMCAEFCGQMHSMMPTVVEAVPEETFSDWKSHVESSML